MTGGKQMYNTIMSMKKMKKNIRTLAALLIASATLAACSSDDNEIQNAQPANPTEPKTYTMTIEATKGDAAATRGLYYGAADPVTGLKPLNVKWNEGEQVEVVQTSGTTSKSLGTLKAKASTNGITTLTGELVGLQTGAQLKFYLHGASYDYTGQKGVLLKADGNNSIEEKYDYAFAATNVYTIDGSNVTVPSGINLEAQQSIVKFTFVDNNGNAINAKSLKIDTKNPIIETINNIDPTGNTQVSKSMTITPAEPTNVIYAAISITEPYTDRPNDYTLTATDADGIKYAYTKKDVTFVNGKYYEVKVTILSHPLSKAVVGEIVGTDGMAYPVTYKDCMPSGVSAVAVVAYKNGSSGLAIALEDVSDSKMTWDTDFGKEIASPSCKAWNESEKAVTGGSWLLPSKGDWENMFNATSGSTTNYTYLNAAITAAGGKALRDVYWTSTWDDPGYGDKVYSVSLESDGAKFKEEELGSLSYVRACLSF